MVKRGFTLIELLVVVGIISVLSAIAVATFQNSQRRARDAARKATVSQIQQAAEQFYLACDAYPADSTAFVSGTTGCSGGISQYLEAGIFPVDPRGGSSDPYEVVSVTLTDYEVCADLELDPPNDTVDSSWTPSQDQDDFCKTSLQ